MKKAKQLGTGKERVRHGPTFWLHQRRTGFFSLRTPIQTQGERRTRSRGKGELTGETGRKGFLTDSLKEKSSWYDI